MHVNWPTFTVLQNLTKYHGVHVPFKVRIEETSLIHSYQSGFQNKLNRQTRDRSYNSIYMKEMELGQNG